MKIKCTKDFSTKHLTFKAGCEDYKGEKINENYWVVDAVGIKTEDFMEHFNVIIK